MVLKLEATTDHLFFEKGSNFFCTGIHIVKQNSLPETVVFPYLATCKKRAVERQ